MTINYKENYRQTRVFKVAYHFTKHYEEMPVVTEIKYFLAFDMTGAFKECVNQYSLGDRKYVEVIYLEELGHAHGIHHFI